MSGTVLEDRLHELFERQAASVRPSLGEWDDVIVDDLAERRDRRRVWMVGASAAACLILIVALGWVATTNDSHTSAGGGRLDLSSDVIQFSADSVVIEVGGQQFSPLDGVEVASDPSPSDPTLELTWTEHGVEMRLNLYFTRNDHNWWLREVRVYDGTPQPEWLTAVRVVDLGESTGVMATGDVEWQVLGVDGAPAGRVVMRNLQLLPRLPGCDRCVNLPVPGGPVPTIDTTVVDVVDVAVPNTVADKKGP